MRKTATVFATALVVGALATPTASARLNVIVGEENLPENPVMSRYIIDPAWVDSPYDGPTSCNGYYGQISDCFQQMPDGTWVQMVTTSWPENNARYPVVEDMVSKIASLSSIR